MLDISQSRIIDLTVEQLEFIIQEQMRQSLPYASIITTRKVDIQKLCSLFGWPKATVYGWAHKRHIPHFKVGKTLLFDLDKIEAWIEENAVKTIKEIKAEF